MTNRFRVRGRHPTVFPVQLPQWLPPKIMREMIARFQSFLALEIKTMMSTDMQYGRTPSRKSQSARSSGSLDDGYNSDDCDVLDTDVQPFAPFMPTDNRAQTPPPQLQ
jgi:hypothetical protein